MPICFRTLVIIVETWSSQESREFKVTPRYLKLSVDSRFPLMVKVKSEKEAVLIGFPSKISFDLDIYLALVCFCSTKEPFFGDHHLF